MRTRLVTTPDGVTHTVPTGITRNRVSACWTVAFRQRVMGTRSFGGADTAASLRLACRELTRRKRAAREAGWLPHLEVRERRRKALFWGYPGVRLDWRQTDSGGARFIARVEHRGRKHGASVPISASMPDAEILARWRLAVAACNALRAAARGTGPRWHGGHIPSRVHAMADLLAVEPALARQVVRQVRAALPRPRTSPD